MSSNHYRARFKNEEVAVQTVVWDLNLEEGLKARRRTEGLTHIVKYCIYTSLQELNCVNHLIDLLVAMVYICLWKICGMVAHWDEATPVLATQGGNAPF